jgi:hypothetical protein
MKRARLTEEQIIGVLKEHEAGAKTADLARKHGVSEAAAATCPANATTYEIFATTSFMHPPHLVVDHIALYLSPRGRNGLARTFPFCLEQAKGSQPPSRPANPCFSKFTADYGGNPRYRPCVRPRGALTDGTPCPYLHAGDDTRRNRWRVCT